MAQGGDLLNKGNVRLSTDRRTMTDKQSESWKQKTRELFPDVKDEDLFFTEKELREFDGAQSILIGYDRSSEASKTGIIRQINQMFGGRVVSSHRNPAMRDRVFRKVRALIEKDKRSKNPKGFVVVAIGALDLGSLPGNPAVFSQIMTQYVTQVDGQDRIDRINEILSAMSAGDLKGIYDASRARGTGGAMAFRLMNEGLDKTALKNGIKTEEEAEDFVEVISDVQNFSDAFTSFNARAKVAKKVIRDNILGVQKGEKGQEEGCLTT